MVVSIHASSHNYATILTMGILPFSLIAQFVFCFNANVQAKISETLVFASVHNGEATGCYSNEESLLPMCFHVTPRAMTIRRQNGAILAAYHTNSARNIHHIQVLSSEFIRFKSRETRTPVLVSNAPGAKINILRRKLKRSLCLDRKEQQELTVFIKEVMQSSVNSFRSRKSRGNEITAGEVAALWGLSSAIQKHELNAELFEPFHLFCLGIVRFLASSKSFNGRYPRNATASLDISTKRQHTAKRLHDSTRMITTTADPKESHLELQSSSQDVQSTSNNRKALETSKNGATEQQHDLDQCGDIRNRSDNNCLGMCGSACWCWDWVCGDCCLHKACLQHDACCRYANTYLSTFCLCPWIYGFDCSHGYGGYPECLTRPSGNCTSRAGVDGLLHT